MPSRPMSVSRQVCDQIGRTKSLEYLFPITTEGALVPVNAGDRTLDSITGRENHLSAQS